MSPESGRLLAASAVLGAYAAFCGLIAWRTRRHRRAIAAQPYARGAQPILVAYASQTGFAEELAQNTAALLQAGLVPVRICGVDGLNADALASARRALFLVSTTGEGDAPDSAAHFVSKVMDGSAPLQGLDYGLLALGDSSYARYCAFGRRLDTWLQAQGATPLFGRIEVDGGAADALRHWQVHVEGLAGTAPGNACLGIVEDTAPWRLVERCVLNPAGLGEPVFRLAFEPVASRPIWQAGDIAIVVPQNPPHLVHGLLAAIGLTGEEPVKGGTLSEALATRQLPTDASCLNRLAPATLAAALPLLPRREYSIASVPEDGRLELLVRRVRRPDGGLGLGSGWLTTHLPVGRDVALQLRPNKGFHAPDVDMPIIFIGNGTGMAGLRAHLHARLLAGYRRNWLLFGERSRAHDFLCDREIESWLTSGDLARLDLAFSRDEPRRYVQDALRAAAPDLRRWVDAGAAIFVCGSAQGMAPGVHKVLQEVLGEEAVMELAATGRYRRDVY
ncbi:sulfite reductase subunit alpha [Neoroseomonas lacus]|uniref:NADPH--hemoprotein reductase n=1 Tax=Neoroseomonas lacus TaxID=287609 RepID=A0A917L382_9PROT|nr:sulfite reductase flavoprotein subunit alpha [Neoroseomonas lacus]GGJ42219.1 sulfite reductase subunit alpha [Neoroseomonas lacus]